MADWWEPFSDSKAPSGSGDSWWKPFTDAASHAKDAVTKRDWGNTADVVSDAVVKGATNIAGMLEDALPVINPLVNPQAAIAGIGRLAHDPRAIFSSPSAERITKNLTGVTGEPLPQDKADVYAHQAVEGGVTFAPLGPAGALSGAGSGVGAQAGSDLFPDSPVAPLIGSIIGGAIGGVHPIMKGLRAGQLIRAGAAHPDFEELWQTAVIPDEGGGTIDNPKTSPKGATGPAQVMPDTAGDPGYGVRPSDGSAADNVRMGKQYFAAMLGKYGDPEKALAAYNAGPGRIDGLVKKYGNDWYDHAPKETQDYVAKGMTRVYGGPQLEGATAPDGLLGNGSVRPMEPSTIADVMADPEAAGLPPENNVVDFPQRETPAPVPEDVLTPAERQDMDASVPKPIVDNTGYERFTPYPEEKTPANDGGNIIGELPTNRLAPAFRTRDGRIFVGPERTGHFGLIEKFPELENELFREDKSATDDSNHPDGFVTPDGRFLSRSEAAKLVNEKGQLVSEEYDFHEGDGAPRHDNDLVVRDQNPPAASETFGTAPPEGVNKTPPTKSEEPHEPPPEQEPEDVSPIDKLRQALDETAILRNKQERGYAQERAKRFQESSQTGQYTSGEEGYYAELSKLKGELPKQAYEGLRDELHQDEIDKLADMIKDHPRLSFGDSLRARGGLMKIVNGDVPTRAELRLLGDVFDKDTLSSLRQGRQESIGDKIANVLSIPRSMVTLLDLAAPGRHALPLIGQKAYWTNIGRMFKAVGSEKAYQNMQNEIMARPTYRLMKRTGLALTNLGDKLSEREELFMSKLAERIPGLGKLYRAGGRGYTIYLNRVRADVFDKFTGIAKAAGADPHEHPEVFKDIAGLINNATGRGTFGRFNGASRLLNSAFFAPRLRLARIQMVNPLYYGKLIKSGALSGVEATKLAGGQGIKAMVSATGIVIMTLGLAKLAGYKVHSDPRRYDFGKINWTDKTSTDVTGGYGTEIRTVAQLISGSYINDKGKKVSLTSGKFGARTRHDVALSYIENSAAPVPAMAIEAMKGKDHSGRKLHMLPKNIGDRGMIADNLTMIPMQETLDAIHEYGAKGLLALPPSLLGFSTRTQRPFKKKKS